MPLVKEVIIVDFRNSGASEKFKCQRRGGIGDAGMGYYSNDVVYNIMYMFYFLFVYGYLYLYER